MPTPSGRTSAAASNTSQSMPAACSESAVVSPPMPPPMMSAFMVPFRRSPAALLPAEEMPIRAAVDNGAATIAPQARPESPFIPEPGNRELSWSPFSCVSVAYSGHI